MTYIIVEIQKDAQGHVGNIVTTKESRAEAESTYHSILASAAISQLPLHGAVLMDEQCITILRQCYDRQDHSEEGL